MLGERFWLFHRGNEAESAERRRRACARASCVDSLTGDQDLVRPTSSRAIRAYDLGELDGVRLSFSDATALTDELVCSPPPPRARPTRRSIRGSVVGTIAADGKVRRLRTIDAGGRSRACTPRSTPGVIDFVFVCDQDSDDEPSPLLSATMPAAEGLES